MIAAHRGFRSIRPENTLCAFEAALDHCHYIELDVQVSSDGVPVIHHDDVLGRTCDIAESVRVDECSLHTLKEYDFGSWFCQADPFQTLKTGQVTQEELDDLVPQRIMTLQELLRWRNVVSIPLNIEIKDQQGEKFDSTIVDLVLTEIKAAECDEQLIVSSFNHDYLSQIQTKYPALALGVLKDGENPPDLLEYLKRFGASAYHPAKEIVSEDLIKELRRNEIDVNIFTVNDQQMMKNFLSQGATSVITDFPDLCVAKDC